MLPSQRPVSSGVLTLAVALSVPVLSGCSGSQSAGVAPIPNPAAAALLRNAAEAAPDKAKITFQTLDNAADPTFNQLLGINNTGVIAGYFGSGAAGHPNKGYLLS